MDVKFKHLTSNSIINNIIIGSSNNNIADPTLVTATTAKTIT